MLTRLIPQNLTQSLLERDVLAVVLFSLFIGIAVVNADKRELTRPIVALAQAVLEVCMTVIRTAMRVAPIAVFGLMADTVASNGLQTLADLAIYCAVVLIGLTLLMLLYIIIVVILGGISPLTFLAAAGPVQLLAFSTSSSAAVMPLTMKTAVEKLDVPPAIAGAVVPLASTVNMAGTALYQAAAIVFLAQSAGTPIALGDLVLIMVTLTGASIGAPAAPGASIAILSATAVNFGVPLYGLPLVLGVDRILDMGPHGGKRHRRSRRLPYSRVQDRARVEGGLCGPAWPSHQRDGHRLSASADLSPKFPPAVGEYLVRVALNLVVVGVLYLKVTASTAGHTDLRPFGGSVILRVLWVVRSRFSGFASAPGVEPPSSSSARRAAGVSPPRDECGRTWL